MKLDLTKVWESQKSLDMAIQKKHNIITNQEIIDKQIIALVVEIAEFANEIKTFKYWKQDQSRDEAKVLEEYADVLHFFISLAIKFEVKPIIEIRNYQGDINDNLLFVFQKVFEFQKQQDINLLIVGFVKFLTLAQWLNYPLDKIFDSYYEKLKINFQRIASNY